MAAAVRLARVITGRDRVLGCGYHGWLDWCQPRRGGGCRRPPAPCTAELPFNDADRTRELIRAAGDRLAAVVFEPVILARARPRVARGAPGGDAPRPARSSSRTRSRPSAAWRWAEACERYGIRPDLVVIGKAIANGFPLAAVGGRADVMDAVSGTWISSTLATEFGLARGRPRDARGDDRGPGADAHHASWAPGCWRGLVRWPHDTSGSWLAWRDSPRCAS